MLRQIFLLAPDLGLLGWKLITSADVRKAEEPRGRPHTARLQHLPFVFPPTRSCS